MRRHFIHGRWLSVAGFGQRRQALFQMAAAFGQLVDGLRLGVNLVAQFGHRVVGVGEAGFQLDQTGVAHGLCAVDRAGVV